MSEEDLQADDRRDPDPGAPEPGAPEPARLRRRPFGYKRADVDQALETRDSQLAELRQDVAALWLAFAQHDRMIRGMAEDADAGGAAQPPPAPDEEPSRDEQALDAPAPEPAESTEAIGRQLSDLDDVLAAIEMATQTLERTYADEISEPEGARGAEDSEPDPPEDDESEPAERP